MTPEDARAAFRSKYVEMGLELAEDSPERLLFKIGETRLTVSAAELEAYAQAASRFSGLALLPRPTSLAGPDYREQIIYEIDPTSSFIGSPYDDHEISFSDPAPETPKVTIGPASDLFIDYFRFREPYFGRWLSRLKRRHARPPSARPPRPERPLRDTLESPLTIRVEHFGTASPADTIAFTDPLIASCLFAVAFSKDAAFRLADSWHVPTSSNAPQFFRLAPLEKSNDLPLPRAIYNSDVVRFYEVGLGAELPEYQFLAFYQVLEYHFVSVSDARLYELLRRRLHDYSFRAVDRQLDGLIQDVLGHSRASDETEMLRGVMSAYVPESELIAFIQAYEEYLGEKWYTKRHDRFGQGHEVKLQPSHVISNIASIIKCVRNALVHSSDRHDRSVRHVPFSEGTLILEREIPLLRFLAEKTIAGTATPR